MTQQSVISIGNFDGVHRGHQALIGRARAKADAIGGRVVAMSFAQHPVTLLRPEHVPPRLSSNAQRERYLRDAGADDVHWLTPTRELLGLEPRAFIEQMVMPWSPAAVVEGENFFFGRKRSGTIHTLDQLGREMGFETIIEPIKTIALRDKTVAPLSSSLIRWLVGHGRMADVAIGLDRAYAVAGPVRVGRQRGRLMNMPTANIDPADQLLPADGVYAGYATVDQTTYLAAISVGTNATFGENPRTCEAHLLDYTGDLYGHPLEIHFTRWLRDQITYTDMAPLIAQMNRDVADVRRYATTGLLDPATQVATL